MDQDDSMRHDEIGDSEGQARAVGWRAWQRVPGLRGRDSRVVERRHRRVRYAALARLARPGGEGRRWGMLSAWPWKI